MALRTIIADDTLRQRDYLERILTDAGFIVVASCHDGPEAVAKSKALKPDIAILDIAMKKMQGDVAARKIKELSPKTIVVLASNNAQNSIAGTLMRDGFLFVSKPYNPNQFLQRLNEALKDGGVL